MLTYIWISLGGAIGTAARFWLSGIVAASSGPMPLRRSMERGSSVVRGSRDAGILTAASGAKPDWIGDSARSDKAMATNVKKQPKIWGLTFIHIMAVMSIVGKTWAACSLHRSESDCGVV